MKGWKKKGVTIYYKEVELFVSGSYKAEEDSTFAYPADPADFEAEFIYTIGGDDIMILLQDEDIREIEVLCIEKIQDYGD